MAGAPRPNVQLLRMPDGQFQVKNLQGDQSKRVQILPRISPQVIQVFERQKIMF